MQDAPTIFRRCCPKNIFTVRERSLRRLCFHRCLSVHRGGGCPIASWDTPPGSRHPSPQSRAPGQQTIPGADPREQCMLGDTSNKRAVCILLECILVPILALGRGGEASGKWSHPTCTQKVNVRVHCKFLVLPLNRKFCLVTTRTLITRINNLS